ncbi:MAG TPA: carboxypeptidase-like regulatory domain-containing protein [Longimicrobium sp.]
MTMRRLPALLLALPLAGCEGDSPTTCPDIVPPMMLIQVQDASTGQPAAEGAGGSIGEGAFTSPLRRYDADRLAPEAVGRPGTYTVVVQKPGFQPWTRTGVQVDVDACGAKTVHLEAFLLPVPQGG